MWVRAFMCLLAVSGPVFSFQDGKSPTGTIAGKVVNQATGAPLPDAIVKLRYVKPSGTDEIIVRQTNEAGRFSFADLWGAEWELSAEHPGFAPATYRATRYSPKGRFSLERNQQITDIVLKLVAQSVVTGKVSDAKGVPVEGARVTLLKAGYSDGIRYWREVASAETLDNGEYRIPRVMEGRYLVRASIVRSDVQRTPSEDAAETAWAETYYPQVADQSLAVPVDAVVGAEARGIDIQLMPTRVFHIRGKLQHQTGWRNVTAHVTLVDRADRTKIIGSFKFLAADSSFDFARIAPGSYVVYSALDVTPDFYFAAQAVDVTDRDVEGLLFNLTQLRDIPGVLKLKSEDPKVDLRKVSVVLPEFQAGMAPTGVTWSAVKIGDDLTFRQRLVESPNYVGFSVTLSNLPEGCYVASIFYGGTEVPRRGIEYSAGATLTITIGADGGRIDGTTVGTGGQPYGGAVIALFPADGKGEVRSLQANAQGVFHFEGIPPGDYTLIAWDDVSQDDLENPQFVKQYESQAARVSVPAGGLATASIKIVGQ